MIARIRLAVGIAVAVVVSTALLTSTFFSSTPAWHYSPDTATEAQMMDTLKPATPEQTAELQKQAAKSEDPMLVAAAKKVYVAIADVALAPVDNPMTIILPSGLRWTHGRLGNIVLVRTAGTTLDDLKTSYAYTDPMCEAQFLGMAPKICNLIEAQTPSNWDAMVSRMRHPTEQELQKWLGKLYVKGDTQKYLVATSDFRAAPQYTFDGNNSNAISGIFLMPGVQVIGGQLGFMDLYRLTQAGVHDATVTDMLCFMAGTPTVWTKATDPNHAGEFNIGSTAGFAPKAEIERVSSCKR